MTSIQGKQETNPLPKPRKLNSYSYIVEKQGNMRVPVKIFASEALMGKMVQDRCLQQGINVAALPGIQGYSFMMPDAHQGYGFSIGGVAAMDAACGCISPGGIGYDINCGVRLLATSLDKEQVYPRIKGLLDKLFIAVPPGMKGKSHLRLDAREMDEVLSEGAQWLLKKGYGTEDDLKNCEEEGRLPYADPAKVSVQAKERGKKHVGTLGSGNHFVEVQYVGKIFDRNVALAFGIEKEGQVVILIHTGSRGLGHQTCSDYLRRMEDSFPDIIASLPEKDLVYAPAASGIAQDYFKAMCAAANFAWANRHMIGHEVRKAFKEFFGPETDVRTVYDVAHNIAKLEKHVVDGVEKEVWVHRKGATRAFGPGRPEIPKHYRSVGQPIFIPGSMGTSSYVLVGTEKAYRESFGSTAHGAGRLLSRHAANQQYRAEDLKKELEEQKIFVKAASFRGVSEEAPKAYKDVDEVVRVSDEAGIGRLVAQLMPMGVIKG
ncbi:TPA: RtcB family protein [Candidatus Woesearchaeota archaeon]|nr:RtcB family protein [Candidatus Woesearchaeota archaeon]HII68660.1 RtcB family protein [Candidatus Woesearchaeota archaeon]